MKKNKQSFISFLLIGLLCISILPIKAANVPETLENEVTINFEANLETNVPGVFPNYSFNFSLGIIGGPSEQFTITQPGTVKGYEIGGAMTDVVRKKTGSALIVFDDNAEIGTYQFLLFQPDPTNKEPGMTYDTTSQYGIEVTIVNQVDEETLKPTGKTTIGFVTIFDNSEKKLEFDPGETSFTINDAFVNKYKSAGGGGEDPKQAALSLNKTVAGKQANANEYFKFEITVNDANMSDNQLFTLVGGSYQANPTTVKNKTTTVVYLKHDETIGIQGLSETASYTIEEKANILDYDASYSINDGTLTSGEKAEGESLVVNGVSVKFINVHKGGDVPPTGVLVEILPFILLGGVAVVVFVSTKRNKNRFEN